MNNIDLLPHEIYAQLVENGLDQSISLKQNIWIVATAQENKLIVGVVSAIVKSVASDTGVK
ncbi:32150_t:CDS:2, partial [Gigaspora margarita]